MLPQLMSQTCSYVSTAEDSSPKLHYTMRAQGESAKTKQGSASGLTLWDKDTEMDY